MDQSPILSFSDIRHLTTAAQNYVYFETSGMAPKPEPVIAETIRWMNFQNQGPAVGTVYQQVLEMFEGVRSRVAKTLNAASDEIMLNENTTVGINVVANGIDWQPGDNVILTTHEHPGNRLPWYNLAQRFRVELRFATATADEQRLLDNIHRLIDDRTRVISISHVSRRMGIRFPVYEIGQLAHYHGIPILLDGAQAFGAIPVDVKALDCDFYTLSGHKYIMAPQGTGAFYARKDRLNWLKPSWIGSHSQVDMDDNGHMTLHDAAKRFEFGTRNMADHAGFGKALEIWESLGWDRVFAHIEDYTDQMKRALQAIPGLEIETPLLYDKSSGIVTAYIPGKEARLLTASLLEKERVVLSPIDTHSIRISTHVFNNQEDMDRLISGLQRLLHREY